MKNLIFILPLIIGFTLDFIFGDPYSLPHPIRWIGTLISKIEKITRKIFNKNEIFSGFILCILVILIVFSISNIILFLSYRLNVLFGILIESIMVYYILAAKSLKKESMKVYNSIQNENIEEARKNVSMIVGRDTKKLNKEEIIKATVETVAENTSDGVIAPIFWTILMGTSFGFIYKAINTLDSMVGYKNEKYINYGKVSARLDDIVNFIPSRISAIFMIISAFILKMDWKKSFLIWKRDRFNHSSPNSAQTESVCAGALNIMLAGDAYYFGKLHKKKTIGDNIKQIENEDIKKVNRLMYCSALLFTFFSILIRFAIINFLIQK